MRSITGTGLIVVALVATLAALAFPLWTYRDRTGTALADLEAGSVTTPWGPLSAADRDFLVRVRLAGLWELPAGQQAIERSPTEAIRRTGEHLVEGHTFLDARVREVAAQLGVELPNQPTAQQRGWLDRFTAARGAEYERTFAQVLRLAHGKIFSVIGQIRHATRNTLVRGLAEDANATVLDHIRMLESTGRVDFDALAADAAGSAAPPGAPATATAAAPTAPAPPPPASPLSPGSALPPPSPAPSGAPDYPLPPAVSLPGPPTGSPSAP
ncbi:DUF4142 domain-containing protein [Streptomyces sp. URMC 123]|uniref:DUF4142 domain-containing protein n=1 Tax=Streptomyces sp. URMC 123 TaxID=3423403 RepID=UPI003F1B9864